MDGVECPVRYWQDSIKNVVQQYLLEFPNGVKRTYIYNHVPKSFRSNCMLAGLCNLCEDVGYSNFANLIDLVEKLSQMTEQPQLGAVVTEIRTLQQYLKTKIANEVKYIFLVVPQVV